MIQRIDHVGIAVHSLDESSRLYQELLGLQEVYRSEHPEFGVKVCFLAGGSADIELLEPLGAESTIAKFLSSRGPGQHHVAFSVDDIVAELARLEAAGYQLIDTTPRHGSLGLVAFVHPKAAGGTLVELVQVQHPTPWRRKD